MRNTALTLMTALALTAGAISEAASASLRPTQPTVALSTIPTANSTLAPFGYVRYCLNNPDDCAAGGESVAMLNEEGFARLRALNVAVNHDIAPRNDVGDDTWAADVTVGDCEDFALTKRRRLLAAGYSPASLRMAEVRTLSGEGHAVLVVRTARGDLVLDNRTDAILPWNKTALTWLKIASAEDAGIWYAVRR